MRITDTLNLLSVPLGDLPGGSEAIADQRRLIERSAVLKRERRNPTVADALRNELQADQRALPAFQAPAGWLFAHMVGGRSRVGIEVGGRWRPITLGRVDKIFLGDNLAAPTTPIHEPSWHEATRIEWRYGTAVLKGVGLLIESSSLSAAPNGTRLHMGHTALENVRAIPLEQLSALPASTVYYRALPDGVAAESELLLGELSGA